MKKVLSLAILALFVADVHSQTLGGTKIFPSNNPWNQRIDSLPVHPHSQAYVNSVGASIHLHPDFGSNAGYGIPWVTVGSTQQFVPITITSGWGEEDKGPMPIPANAPVEGAGVGDAHVLVVDTSNHHLYELYQGKKDASGNGWSATTSAIFALDSNNYRPDGWTSCDAAGLPIWPGLVRKYECDAGEIKHAIRFTVQKTSKGWVFPARHHAGSTTDTTNVMPMGMRFRLKGSFDDSKFTGNAKVIATAMKRYGIIMADNGSNWFITGETNTNWDDNDISQLKAIVGNDFEAVYTGPIRTPSNYTSFADTVIPIPTDGLPNSPKISAATVWQDTAWAGTQHAFSIPIQNTGDATLNISLTKIKSGTHFTLVAAPTSIAPGSSMNANVVFSAATPGQYVDTLTIKSDDPLNSGFKIVLIGTATSGVAQLPQNIDFGKVKIGTADTMRLKLLNSGNGPLILNALSPDGTNADFSAVAVQPAKFPPDTIAPGDSVVAWIRFAPSAVGPESTSFAISLTSYPGATSLASVALQGEGVTSSGVAEQPESAFEVYPNPADAKMTVKLANDERVEEIELIDAAGRVVMQSDRATILDLSHVPNGAYSIRIMSSNGVRTAQIVVKH